MPQNFDGLVNSVGAPLVIGGETHSQLSALSREADLLGGHQP